MTDHLACRRGGVGWRSYDAGGGPRCTRQVLTKKARATSSWSTSGSRCEHPPTPTDGPGYRQEAAWPARAFSRTNPNRYRAVVSTFAGANPRSLPRRGLARATPSSIRRRGHHRRDKTNNPAAPVPPPPRHGLSRRGRARLCDALDKACLEVSNVTAGHVEARGRDRDAVAHADSRGLGAAAACR